MGEVPMIKVRVQNFQSIKNASVDIDGFTVVTGPNNSGKSALMRAIRGVFTNAPGGPLVRHGAPHLSVGLEFDDGSTVVWEKGGKTNRYTVNGKTLSSVGRGVPPEVEALGIGEIRAGSDRIWPQIAEQFTGSLFLVGRPGSVVAEALSDVDRVGALTEALRLSESDRRSATSELKVRRKDLKGFKEETEAFAGFDAVLKAVTALQGAKRAAGDVEQRLAQAEGFTVRLEAARNELKVFEALDEAALDGFDAVRETCDRVAATGRDWETARTLHVALVKAAAGAAGPSDADIPTVPDPDPADKLRRGIDAVRELERQVTRAADDVACADIESERLRVELDAVTTEVSILLGTRGVCPTCGTVCASPSAHVAVGGEA
jgi:exonuclease SbcC